VVKTFTTVLVAAGLLASGSFCPLAAAVPEPGTISFDTRSVQTAPGYPVGVFVEAVSEVLASKGYTVLEGQGHARLVAELRLTQTAVGTANAKVPPPDKPTVAGRGTTGVGGTVIVPLPSGKVRLVSTLQTRLEIRIRRLGENNVLWSSAALTVRPSGTESGLATVVAADMAKAIFRIYPAQPESVAAVP
jgi:hypothetical protein